MKSHKKTLSSACLVAGLLAVPWTNWAADAKTEVKPYPLSKCIVSGEKLGEMGKPYVMVREGRQIKFCCKGCVDDFNKTPAAFLKKIDAAAKQAAKEHPYPLSKCLVSGEKLGADVGKPFAFVYEDREIKLCCESCLKDFNKNPDKYMRQLAAAAVPAKK